MLVKYGDCAIELAQGDITQQTVDAIVNAANDRLAGGGGVDGAIHRSAGSTLMEETKMRYPDGCPTGHAVASGAGALSAKHVFHAVGPVWNGGQHQEPDLLESAFRCCFELAIEHNCDSIALPALSTGAYGYPIDLAAEVSLGSASRFLVENRKPRLVRFVLFDSGAYGAFARVLESMAE